MGAALSAYRRVTWRAAAAAAAVAATGIALGVSLTAGSDQQAARRASLSGVQRTIRTAVSQAVAGSQGPDGRAGGRRRVVLALPLAPTRVYSVNLSGSAMLARSYPKLERGASATARIQFSSVRGKTYGRVCWTIRSLHSQEPVTAGGVYQASRGLEGPRVILLVSSPGASWRRDACALVYSSLMLEIAHDPAGFYVQLETTRHPAGAVRGQL
jgi:hypothetical protein